MHAGAKTEGWTPKPNDSARYDKRLAIIVPYRNRAQHLSIFLPHILSYFKSDKLDRRIAMSLHVVEQSGSAPFNRGRLKNVGYVLTRDQANYVCFHDVDYLPIWADYSWSPRPARLIWYGLTQREDWERFLGGVVLFDNASFERINGYPNSYWGWGFEDRELGLRCEIVGIDWERRDGTYGPLPHPHSGETPAGTLTPEAQATRELFHQRWPSMDTLMKGEGLSDLRFKTLRTERLRLAGQELPNAFHHMVDIE